MSDSTEVQPLFSGNPARLASSVLEQAGLQQQIRRRGKAFVFSGPSGVGKDAVLDYFLPRFPDCERLVTVTTRPKRDDEIDGVHYIFVSPERFEALEAEGQFLETADVYGFKYGSPKWKVQELTGAGTDVILKLDVQGGLTVKKRMPEAVMIFLAAPSLEELERRLRGRDTETPESLRRRLGKAEWEMSQIPEYHYIVINDVIERAARDLGAIITAERAKLGEE